MKIQHIGSSLILALGLSLFPVDSEVRAGETLVVDRDFALERHIDVEVTPSGVVLDIGSAVTSVKLPHLKNINVNGFDGCLGTPYNPCGEEVPPPTKLFLQKNTPIDFPEQIDNPGGVTILYVNTAENFTYRYRLTPTNGKPKHTLVEIVDNPVEPLFDSPDSSTEREIIDDTAEPLFDSPDSSTERDITDDTAEPLFDSPDSSTGGDTQ